MERIDIRKLIKYCYSRQLSTTNARLELCTTHGSEFVSLSTVQRWYKKFREGEGGVEDAPRSGRPLKDVDDRIAEQLIVNKRATTREIAGQLGECHETVWRHLIKIGKRYLENVWVPYNLSPANRERCVEVCSQLLEMMSINNFLNQLVTVDEIWIYWDNQGTFNNKSWRGVGDEPLATTSRTITTKKHMATVFWDVKGLILMDVLPRNRTINAEYYCEQLDKLVVAIQEKRRRLISTGNHNIHF